LKIGFFSLLGKFRSVLNRERFDILQVFFLDSLFVTYMATFLIKNKPVLVANQRDMGLGSGDLWYHRIYEWLRPLVYKRFQYVVVNADSLRQHLIAGRKVPASKITVIYNGIELETECYPPPTIFRQKSVNLWIGMVANLNPVKRVDIFLAALAIMKNKYHVSEFNAVVLGEGPERERLLQIVKQLGIEKPVHFIGSVDHVYAYLNHIDLAVLCSEREGFPNAILEYMVCSLPVVATAVGGTAELVNEKNGICVPSGDPEALAQAMATLAMDKALRIKLGKRSRKILENSYSWEKSMTEWQNFYRNPTLMRDGRSRKSDLIE
jgi:glycosyltransferase involved in cell wall biosynthesis